MDRSALVIGADDLRRIRGEETRVTGPESACDEGQINRGAGDLVAGKRTSLDSRQRLQNTVFGHAERRERALILPPLVRDVDMLALEGRTVSARAGAGLKGTHRLERTSAR